MDQSNRVFGRMGARELTYEETQRINGAVNTNVCTAPLATVYLHQNRPLRWGRRHTRSAPPPNATSYDGNAGECFPCRESDVVRKYKSSN
jgi:hypothetical protein